MIIRSKLCRFRTARRRPMWGAVARARGRKESERAQTENTLGQKNNNNNDISAQQTPPSQLLFDVPGNKCATGIGRLLRWILSTKKL